MTLELPVSGCPALFRQDRRMTALKAVHLRSPGRRIPQGPHLFHLFLKYVPLLWVLGALTPIAALTVVRLAVGRWPRGVLVNLVVCSWFAIGASQAMATLLNGLEIGSPAKGVANSFGFGVSGWILGGLAIAAGAGHRLCGQRTIRATTWLGGYILILSAVAAVARLAGMHALSISPTLVSLFLPPSPSVNFYASALLFQTEETLGEATTRLVLFFPWTTGLGLGGLAIAFISTLDRDYRWRAIGFAGGAVGVVFSWSRIAIATMIGVGALLLFFRLPKLCRLAVVGMLLLSLFGLALDGINPFLEITRARDTANQARAGSSMARDLIYQKSWEGFLQSPVIGHGWIGESVHRIESLPIGSHSTIYGLLYTGGLPTASTFVLAMLLTLGAVLCRLPASYRRGYMARNKILVAIALTFCLATYCPYEALYNLTLPCVFLFTWIGACIGNQNDVPEPLQKSPSTPAPAPVIRALGPVPAPRNRSAFHRHPPEGVKIPT